MKSFREKAVKKAQLRLKSGSDSIKAAFRDFSLYFAIPVIENARLYTVFLRIPRNKGTFWYYLFSLLSFPVLRRQNQEGISALP